MILFSCVWLAMSSPGHPNRGPVLSICNWKKNKKQISNNRGDSDIAESMWICALDHCTLWYSSYQKHSILGRFNYTKQRWTLSWQLDRYNRTIRPTRFIMVATEANVYTLRKARVSGVTWYGFRIYVSAVLLTILSLGWKLSNFYFRFLHFILHINSILLMIFCDHA